MITGVSVVPGIAKVSVIAVIRAPILGGSVVHQAVVENDFPQITPFHINENLFVVEVVTDVLTGGRVEALSLNKIRDVLSLAIEQEIHSRILTCNSGYRFKLKLLDIGVQTRPGF